MLLSKRPHHAICNLLFVVGVLAFSHPSAAESTSEKVNSTPKRLAQKLVKLRRQVEELSQQLADKQSAKSDRLRVLRQHQAQLEMNLNKQKIRHKVLLQTQSAAKTTKSAIDARSEKLLEPTAQIVRLMREHIRASLPYKQNERLAALDKAEKLINTNNPNPSAALNHIWRLLEDEAALNDSFEINNDVLILEGRKTLVEVARIGMALLYFRTKTNRFGWLQPHGPGYKPYFFNNEEIDLALDKLFADIRSQKTHFHAELPFSLTTGKRK